VSICLRAARTWDPTFSRLPFPRPTEHVAEPDSTSRPRGRAGNTT
jgi:hypothetical protein